MINDKITVFDGKKFGEIRTIEIDGEVYLFSIDVAKALEYNRPRDAVYRKVDEEDRLVINSWISNPQNKKRGNPNVTIINESGLFLFHILLLMVSLMMTIFSSV